MHRHEYHRCGAMRVADGEYMPGERYHLRAGGDPTAR